MKTILYAHTGSGNHGCEALVRSTAKLLDTTPVLFSTGYDEDLQLGVPDIAKVERDTAVSIPRRSAAYVAAACQTKLTKRTTLFTQYAHKNLLDQVQAGDLCLSIGGDNYCYAGTEILGDLNIPDDRYCKCNFHISGRSLSRWDWRSPLFLHILSSGTRLNYEYLLL